MLNETNGGISSGVELTGVAAIVLAVFAAVFGKEPVARWWNSKSKREEREEQRREDAEERYLKHLEETVRELSSSTAEQLRTFAAQLELAREREIKLRSDLAVAQSEIARLREQVDELESEVAKYQGAPR